jgi:hypothetical protein
MVSRRSESGSLARTQDEEEEVCVGDMYDTIPHEASLATRLLLAQSILIVPVLVELWWV